MAEMKLHVRFMKDSDWVDPASIPGSGGPEQKPCQYCEIKNQSNRQERHIIHASLHLVKQLYNSNHPQFMMRLAPFLFFSKGKLRCEPFALVCHHAMLNSFFQWTCQIFNSLFANHGVVEYEGGSLMIRPVGAQARIVPMLLRLFTLSRLESLRRV